MRPETYFEKEVDIRFVNAVGRGDQARMREYLAKGADVNAEGRQGMRPLFWALAKQNLKGFSFLLEHGADPNVVAAGLREKERQASLMSLAAMMAIPEYLRLALAYGGDPNCPLGFADRTIIDEAIMNHRTANVKILIDAGADIDHRDSTGSTPMMTAADINQYKIVYLLLKAGADPSIKNRWGYDLMDAIELYGGRGMKKTSGEYKWYLRVVEELQKRELLPAKHGEKASGVGAE